MKAIPVILILLLQIGILFAQLNPSDVGEVFRDDEIPRIDITINENDFNTLIQDIGSDVEYPATFRFSNSVIDEELDSVGFRLKGNVNRIIDKKSFKISINTFKKGRKFYGLEKINLIGNAVDPMMVRPRLAWYLAGSIGNVYLNTNYVRLYINNTFKGIYVNTEQIDEIFLKKWFGNNSGNLYKGRYPASLQYVSDNPDDYKSTAIYFANRELRIYELKTNIEKDNYSDLEKFIRLLNNPEASNFQDSITKYLNVQSYLKFLAFENFIGHWDNYTTNANNYMIYNNPQTNQFEYLTFDTDLTFGVNFSPNVAACNIYKMTDLLPNRPLTNNLLNIKEFRDMYTFFHRQLIAMFPKDSIRKIVDLLRDEVRPYIFDDPFYSSGFTKEIFESNIDQPFGSDSYGLMNFMSIRIDSTVEQLDNSNTAPIITKFKTNDGYSTESLSVSCMVENEDENLEIALQYRFENEEFKTAFFNIENHSSIPFTRICEVKLNPFNETGILKIKIVATDEMGNTSYFPIDGEYSVNIYKSTPGLKINEILAINRGSITDDHGQHEDWLELVNLDTSTIIASNCYLSDEPDNLGKWSLPDKELQPNEFIWVWTDDDAGQGEYHANFKLSGNGETVYLSEKQDGVFHILDSMEFKEQQPDISYGPAVEGSISYDFLSRITPGFANTTEGLAYGIFNIDMSQQIRKNNFIIGKDVVDVVGNFNNWESSISFSDPDHDSIYTYTSMYLNENDKIEYRFRINHNNELIEFHGTPAADMHRKYTLNEGVNTLNHLFNEEISDGLIGTTALEGIEIFPNPFTDYLTIKSVFSPDMVLIFDATGRKVMDIDMKNKSEYLINVSDLPEGLYLVKAVQGSRVYTVKMIKAGK
jgi:spore coat protein H